jgi:hypothetical protein
MSSLADSEKRYLEKLLGMENGRVLDYSDEKYGRFFSRHGINIHDRKYQTYGTSKAKKTRAFWEIESDALVSKIMSELIDSCEAESEIQKQSIDSTLLEKSRGIVARLSGKPIPPKTSQTNESFLEREFTIPNIQKLPIETQVIPIIESRLSEARIALNAKAHLSVIFLCGSVLEAVLLGAAQKEPARFNKASASPKSVNGNTKQFYDWNLAQLIDVASEIDLLKPDVKKFSHGLRDFRNYIHPYEQMVSGFTPDEHTAKLCFQVLKAALASVAGER